MNFKDLSVVMVPDGDETKECYRITRSDGSNVWWSTVDITYYRQTNKKELLKKETIYYGQDGTISGYPELTPDRIGNYYKDSWSSPCTNVTADITAILKYSEKYDVIYKEDANNSVYKTELCVANASVDFGEAPFIKYYTFTKFDPVKISSLKSSTTVCANYSKNDIIVAGISSIYKYDEAMHPFVVSAYGNNGGDVTVEYSKTSSGDDWQEEPFSLSDADSTETIWYRMSADNYPEEILSGHLRI